MMLSRLCSCLETLCVTRPQAKKDKAKSEACEYFSVITTGGGHREVGAAEANQMMYENQA